MFRIILLLLILFSNFLFSQNITLHDLPINFYDFRKVERSLYQTSNHVASIRVSINRNIKEEILKNNVYTTLSLTMDINRDDSWILKEFHGNPFDLQSIDLLNHEKIHFAIWLIGFNTMIEEMKQINDYLNIEIISDSIFKSITKRTMEIQNLYDSTTNHGLRKDAQKKWEKMIMAELNQYFEQIIRLPLKIEMKFLKKIGQTPIIKSRDNYQYSKAELKFIDEFEKNVERIRNYDSFLIQSDKLRFIDGSIELVNSDSNVQRIYYNSDIEFSKDFEIEIKYKILYNDNRNEPLFLQFGYDILNLNSSILYIGNSSFDFLNCTGSIDHTYCTKEVGYLRNKNKNDYNVISVRKVNKNYELFQN